MGSGLDGSGAAGNIKLLPTLLSRGLKAPLPISADLRKPLTVKVGYPKGLYRPFTAGAFSIMDNNITQNQPEIDSIDSSFDSSTDVGDNKQYFANQPKRFNETMVNYAERRYMHYREKYLDLLYQMFDEACECQLQHFDHGSNDVKAWKEQREDIIDDFLWRIMDRDLLFADEVLIKE